MSLRRAGLEGHSCSTAPRMFLDTVWLTPSSSSEKTDVIATRWSRGPAKRSLFERDSRRGLTATIEMSNKSGVITMRCLATASRGALDTVGQTGESWPRGLIGQTSLEKVDRARRHATISMMVARHHVMVSRAGTASFYKAQGLKRWPRGKRLPSLSDLSEPSLHDVCRAH